jgi:hypothetical protein
MLPPVDFTAALAARLEMAHKDGGIGTVCPSSFPRGLPVFLNGHGPTLPVLDLVSVAGAEIFFLP